MASRAWAMNVGGTDSVGAATITAADDLITVTAHGLADGDLVAFDTLALGADGPLEADTPYFVRDATTDTFRVSGSQGGALIEFATDGTANVSIAVPTYSAEELRQIGSHDLFHGATDRLGARQGVRPGGGDPASVSGTTWTVHDHTGVVDQSVTSTQGPYKYAQLEQSDPLNPADGSNDRFDGLDLLIEDDDVTPSGQRRSRIVYAPGTPGGGEPAVTTGASRLATILVPAGGSPTPTVDSLALWAVSSGGTLPVRDTSERPTAGRYEGMLAYRQDIDALEVWDGSAWQILARPDEPVKGWTPIASGEQSGGTGAFDIDITDGGRWPAGTFAHLRLSLQGDLDAVGTIRMRVNSQSSGYLTGLKVEDPTGNVDLSEHEAAGQQWILASWATVSTNSCEVLVFETDTTSLSYQSTGQRPSGTLSVHNYSQGWGVLTASALVSSVNLRPFSSGANVWGDRLTWDVEGYRR